MYRPKISIIMPVYNGEKYIEEAITSALHQSIEDKEIVIIDDDSYDETPSIIESLASKNCIIKYFHIKHLGVAAARNLGINKAQGEYISFLDTDDFYIDDKALETIVYATEIEKCKVGAGLRQIFPVDDEAYADELFRDFFNLNEKYKVIDFFDYQEDFHFQNYIFRKDFLIENNLLFSNLRRYQDPPFLLDAMSIAKNCAVCNIEMYGYRLGHQDENRQIEYIKDTLEGVKYNIQKADEFGYNILVDRLIERINRKYHHFIVRNLSRDVLEKLIEIGDVAEKYGLSLDVMDKIKMLNALELRVASDEILLCISQLKLENKSLSYFIDNEYITIYGLGQFGKLVVDELIDSEIEFETVDKNDIEYRGYRAKKIERISEKSELILITPIDEKQVEEIRYMIEKKVHKDISVITLQELIWRINKEISL